MKDRKIVLATFGSHGDLNPFIAVALELKSQGAIPVIASWPDYRAKVGAAGIQFHAVRPSLERVRADLNMDEREMFRHVMNDPAFLFRDMSAPYLREAYEDMTAVLADAALVLTSILAFSARFAAEKLGISCLGVALQPLLLPSAYDLPLNPHAPLLSKLIRKSGPSVSGWALQLGKKAISRFAAPMVAFRKELGLPADSRDPIIDAQYSSCGALGLYSPMLGGVQPDHPPATRICGFAFYDDDPEEDAEPFAALEQFFAAGFAPLVFVLGSSAHVDAGDFFEVSVEAAKTLGRRAILVTGSDTRSALHSPDIFVCRYMAYSKVFPKGAVIVNQGGVGTLAQALRAGRPQLIVPFHGDQLDNGSRVARLGAGRMLERRRYKKYYLVRELQPLLEDGRHASAAAQAALRIREEEGAAAAVNMIADTLSKG